MAKSKQRPPNGPSTQEGNASGGGRGNNPPASPKPTKGK